jgi:hypothetical protein
MTHGDTTFYRQRPNLVVTDVPDGVVVSDETGTVLHVLNPTAAAILMLCDGSLGANQIAVLLKEECFLTQPPLDDVMTCLRDLSEHGLVTATQVPASS